MSEQKWCLYDNNEIDGAYTDTTIYSSKEEALSAADYDWNNLTKFEKERRIEFYVGLFDIDENGMPTDCWIIAKDFKHPENNNGVEYWSDKELSRAIELLEYLEIDNPVEKLEANIEHDYLTTAEARNGKSYVWYYDGRLNAVIDVVSGEIIDDETFIDDEFC